MFDNERLGEQPDAWQPSGGSDTVSQETRDPEEPAITAPAEDEEGAGLPAAEDMGGSPPAGLPGAEIAVRTVVVTGEAIAADEESEDEFSGSGARAQDAGEPQDTAAVAVTEEVRNSQNIITDEELRDLLLAGIDAVGVERLDRILEAGRHLNATGYEHPVIKDEFIGHKKHLGAMPDYADAIQQSGVLPEAADSILEHALVESSHPQINPASRVTASVTGLIDALNYTDQIPTEASLNATHQMLWVAGEVDEASSALTACEAGCRAGLQLADSAEVVERVLAATDPRYASYDTKGLRVALESLERADVPPAVTKEVFADLGQVDPRYREDAYSAFTRTIDDAKEQGIPRDDVMETIQRQISPERPVSVIVYDIQTYGYDVVRRFR